MAGMICIFRFMHSAALRLWTRSTRVRRTSGPLAAGFVVLFVGSITPQVAYAQSKEKHVTQKAIAAHPADIDRIGVLILTRTTLLALDQANKTGNYTVLRDLGSTSFQANTAAQLGDIFASQRKQALDFGAVAVLEPQLTLLPQIEPNGMLHMAGFFPSVPLQVKFELLFQPVNRQWKIYGLSVSVAPSGPQAPEAPVAALSGMANANPVPEAPPNSAKPKKVTKP